MCVEQRSHISCPAGRLGQADFGTSRARKRGRKKLSHRADRIVRHFCIWIICTPTFGRSCSLPLAATIHEKPPLSNVPWHECVRQQFYCWQKASREINNHDHIGSPHLRAVTHIQACTPSTCRLIILEICLRERKEVHCTYFPLRVSIALRALIGEFCHDSDTCHEGAWHRADHVLDALYQT